MNKDAEKFLHIRLNTLLLLYEAKKLNSSNKADSFARFADASKMFSEFVKELFDYKFPNMPESINEAANALERTFENAASAFLKEEPSEYEVILQKMIPSFCKFCNEICASFWNIPPSDENPGIHSEEELELRILLEPTSIAVKCDIPDKELNRKASFTGGIEYNLRRLQYWLLNCVKPVFERMPLKAFKIIYAIPIDQKNNPEYTNTALRLFGFFDRIMQNTNHYLLDYMWLKGIAVSNTNLLFYLFDNESRMMGFYHHYSVYYPGKMFLRAYPNGWNDKYRRWEETGYRLSVADFLSDILKDGIRKVIGINEFLYCDGIMHENVYLPWIFKYLGIEFIGHDVDPVELGGMALSRSAGQLEGMTRFTVLPVLAREWDEYYKNKGIFYTPLLQHYSFEEEAFELQEDYSVLVLSQSRLNNVICQFDLILYLVDRIDGNCVYTDYQLWYLALRKLLFELFENDEIRLIQCGDLLHQTMYHIAQFLKYEVINSVTTDRKLLVYGDDGWNVVFPQYFQGTHLIDEQIAEMDRQKRYLHLLFHNSFSYLETGGPVFDAIAKNRVFINYPALARTDLYRGFSQIEYTGRGDINRLIENVREVYTRQDLHASIRGYKSVMKDFENNMVNYLIKGIPYPEDGGEYYRGCKEHYLLIDRMIEDYAQKNAEFLLESMEILFFGKKITMDVSKTKYFNRDYIQRLYAFINRSQGVL